MKSKGIVSEEGENICDLSCGCGGKIIGLSNLLPVGSEVYILEKNDVNLLKSLYEDIKKEDDQKSSIVEDDIFGDILKRNSKMVILN